MQLSSSATTQQPGVKYYVADIFRMHIGEYKHTHWLSYEQAKAVSAILDCRTSALGGVWKTCEKCKRWDFYYKPCKNRHLYKAVEKP